MTKEEITQALKFLENLPEDRKLYYRFGRLLVEVKKEEAESLLKEALSFLEKEKNNKGGHAG